jgi:predicted outer membrane protein
VSTGNATLESLRSVAKPQFDRQYLLAQLARSEQTLALFDATLLPATKSPDLRVYVGSARDALLDHQREARAVLMSLAED